ncbi:MAG: 3-dehydroquinate synthase [Ruminiclostridium sp.]|nr:3-dehydroquinate synthase [Ruminiclostridium sp.]
MTTIQVKASRAYEVKIGRGLLSSLGTEAAGLVTGRSAAIVSDTNVAPLYLDRVKTSLTEAGFRTCEFVFPAGESSKNGETYLNLLEFLAENQITRTDTLVALGGGVVGDLTGFAAATFLRGVDFLQLPTTLLAAVDASVGGKTAIDLKNGKNLAGAFYQPRLVLCDLDTLDTLPDDIFADGCAEVIKYGMIGDRDLLDLLARKHFRKDPEEVVARCIAMKRDLVEEDEFDTGARQLLNLGHTVGHGIEACSGYGISHGKAVAVGMTILTRAAIEQGVCEKEILEKLQKLLKQYGLPDRTGYATADLYERTLSDKKRTGGTITLVVPADWGKSVLRKIPVEDLKIWIEKGL